MSEAKDEGGDKKDEKKDDKGAEGAGEEAKENTQEKVKILLDTVNKVERIKKSNDDEKVELDKIRRWKVIVKDIKLTPLDEMFDGFVQITIGGDYRVISYSIPKKSREWLEITGERGYTDFTEVIKDLKKGVKNSYQKIIDIEIRDSVINLMKQNLIIEVWDFNTLSLNKFIGIHMFNIMDIIKGNMIQNCIIKTKMEDGKSEKDFVKVELKCVFQEIWDFILSYEDWKADELDFLFAKENSKGLNAGIQFSLSSDRGQLIRNNVYKPDVANPEWSTFTRDMKFRGTLNDLENQVLNIDILADGSSLMIAKEEISSINTELKGVSTDGMFKINVLPTNDIRVKVANFYQGDIPETKVRGKINANTLPRYRQLGEDNFIQIEEIYFCIMLKKLSVPNLPNHIKQTLRLFLTVEWGGLTKESRKQTFSNSIKFNEEFYFLFGISNQLVYEAQIVREREILEILKTVKNEVTVTLWAEDIYGCRDFVGLMQVELIDIFEAGKNKEKTYRIDDVREINYYTPVYSNKRGFESALLKEDISLDFEYWLYPGQLTKGITDLNREKIKKDEKPNPKLEEIKKSVRSIKQELEDLKDKLKDLFEIDQKYRFFDFKFKTDDEEGQGEANNLDLFHVLDQNKQERVINSFLSKLTIKGPSLHPKCFESNIQVLLRDKKFIEKVVFPITQPENLIHYIKCYRYITTGHEEVLHSPDIFMGNKKGTKYEHVFFMACLMMFMFSKDKHLKEDEDELDVLQREFKREVLDKLAKNEEGKEDGKEEGGGGEEAAKDKEKDEKDNKKEVEMTDIKTKTNDETGIVNDGDKTSINLLAESGEKKDNAGENLQAGPPGEIFNKEELMKMKKVYEQKIEKLKTLRKVGNSDTKIKFDTSNLVFLCMGTLKGGELGTSLKHLFLMTFDTNFKDVEFWEPMNNKKYRLEDRVDQPDILKNFFKGTYDKEEQIEKALRLVKQDNAKKADNADAKKGKNKKNKNQKQFGENDPIPQDTVAIKGQKIIQDIEDMEKNKNILNKTKYEEGKDVDKFFVVGNDFVEEKGEPIKVGGAEVVHFFWKDEYDKNNVKNDVLPYKTIDVIFNKQNIYVNKQHPDPTKILYDIYDSVKWEKIIKIKKNDQNLLWKEDINAFYSFRNFQPTYTMDQIEEIQKQIIKTVNLNIKSIRMSKNMGTKNKSYAKEWNDLLDLYLIFLEMKDLNVDSKEKHVEKIINWKDFLKSKLPSKTRFCMLPLFFNYVYENSIASYLNEFCTSFLQSSKKNPQFCTTCKIFAYPNKVVSLRILITMTYKITQEDHDLSENLEDQVYQTIVTNQAVGDEEKEKLLGNDNK